MTLQEFKGDLSLEIVVRSVQQPESGVVVSVSTSSGAKDIRAKYAVCKIPL